MATKDYLNPRWQKKRLRIMERDGFTCKSCGDQHKTLHVHHRSYEKGKRIWDTPDEDLVTLCGDCHESVEEMVRVVRRIGDSIAFLEAVGIAPSPLINRIARVVEVACKSETWGNATLRTLDCFIDSMLESIQEAA